MNPLASADLTPSPRLARRSFHALILLGLAALMFISRLYSYREPPDWDVCSYAIIGHELNCGAKLYADIWDIKPPAVYVTYAAAERLAGYGLGQIFLISMAVSLVTLVAIYFAGRAAGPAGGLIAASLYALVGGDLQLDANRPNTECFINACQAIVIALLVMHWPRHRVRRLVLVGLFIALASLYKQVAILPGLAVIVAVSGSWRQRMARLGGTLAIVAVVWLMVWSYFAATGRGGLAWITFYTAPRFYGGSLVQTFVSAMHPSHLAPAELYGLLPCLALTIIAIARPPSRMGRALLPAVLLATYAAIAWPGKFYLHYYQLWLVPVTIAAGWGAAALLRWPGWNERLLLPRLAITVAVIGTGWLTAWTYQLPPQKWAERNYSTFYNWFVLVGEELNTRLPPGETFYDWSDSACLYFFAHRRPPTPALWSEHLTRGPLAEPLTTSSLAKLQAHPPRYVTIWYSSDLSGDTPIARWIQENYVRVNDRVARLPLVLMERR